MRFNDNASRKRLLCYFVLFAVSPHTYHRLGLCHVGVGVWPAVGGGNTMGVLEERVVICLPCMLT
jgi:hypothetical protein